MTVGQIANIPEPKLSEAIGERRAKLVREWVEGIDLNLSHATTKTSLKAVKGLGRVSVRKIQALVDGSWDTTR